MSVGHPSEFSVSLARLAYSSLTDLFIDRPTLHFWNVAHLLSDDAGQFAPVHIERALRAECERRDDLHFFARVALFTALHSLNERGWSKQHYMLAGIFRGILGASANERGHLCWDHLKSLNLPDGWKPASIFDPVLEAALKSGFPHQPIPTK